MCVCVRGRPAVLSQASMMSHYLMQCIVPILKQPSLCLVIDGCLLLIPEAFSFYRCAHRTANNQMQQIIGSRLVFHGSNFSEVVGILASQIG